MKRSHSRKSGSNYNDDDLEQFIHLVQVLIEDVKKCQKALRAKIKAEGQKRAHKGSGITKFTNFCNSGSSGSSNKETTVSEVVLQAVQEEGSSWDLTSSVLSGSEHGSTLSLESVNDEEPKSPMGAVRPGLLSDGSPETDTEELTEAEVKQKHSSPTKLKNILSASPRRKLRVHPIDSSKAHTSPNLEPDKPSIKRLVDQQKNQRGTCPDLWRGPSGISDTTQLEEGDGLRSRSSSNNSALPLLSEQGHFKDSSSSFVSENVSPRGTSSVEIGNGMVIDDLMIATDDESLPMRSLGSGSADHLLEEEVKHNSPRRKRTLKLEWSPEVSTRKPLHMLRSRDTRSSSGSPDVLHSFFKHTARKSSSIDNSIKSSKSTCSLLSKGGDLSPKADNKYIRSIKQIQRQFSRKASANPSFHGSSTLIDTSETDTEEPPASATSTPAKDSMANFVSKLKVKVHKPIGVPKQTMDEFDADISRELEMMDRHEMEMEVDIEEKVPYLINGEGRYWCAWERCMILLTATAFITETMQAGFAYGETSLSHGFVVLLKTLDVLFFIDLVIVFLVTYLHPDTQREVTDFKKIAQHYLKTTFTIKLMAAIPVNLITLPNGKTLVIEEWWLCFLRLPNLIHALTQDVGFDTIIQERPMVYRAVKMVFVFFLILHLMCCAYWYNSEDMYFLTEMSPPSHVVEGGLAEKYSHALMKSLSVLSSSDLVTETKMENMFMIVGLCVSFLLDGVLIGSFSNLLSEDGTMAERKRQAQGLQNFMREHRLPQSLQKLINDYVDYQWDIGQNQYMDSMFNELPAKLKMGLDLQLQRTFVEKTPIMKHLPTVGIVSLVQSLKPRIAQPSELIIHQNDYGHSMYFISTGTVRVYLGPNDNGTYLISLGPGNQFGEIALMRNGRRTANCRALQFAELFELHKDHFTSFCESYPIFERVMSILCQTRLRISRSMQDAQKLANKLGLHKGRQTVNFKKFRVQKSMRWMKSHELSYSESDGFSHTGPKELLRSMRNRINSRFNLHLDPDHNLHHRESKLWAKGVASEKYRMYYKTVRTAEEMSMCCIDNANFSDSCFSASSFFQSSLGSNLCRLDSEEAKHEAITIAHHITPSDSQNRVQSPTKSFFFHRDEDVTLNTLGNSSSSLGSSQKLFRERGPNMYVCENASVPCNNNDSLTVSSISSFGQSGSLKMSSVGDLNSARAHSVRNVGSKLSSVKELL